MTCTNLLSKREAIFGILGPFRVPSAFNSQCQVWIHGRTWWPALISSRARKSPMKRVPPIIKIFFDSTAEAVTTALRAVVASLTSPMSTPSLDESHRCHNHETNPKLKTRTRTPPMALAAFPSASKRKVQRIRRPWLAHSPGSPIADQPRSP